MAYWLRQVSTGTVTLRLGPFVDGTDAKTPETALTISQADVRLSKNGGDFAQKSDATAATHDEGGWYIVTFDATDLGTLGTLDISIQETEALPYFKSFMIVSQQVWDSVFSTDMLQVHAAEISNDLITAAAIATDAIAEIADGVWDENIDSAHQTANTAGKRLDDASTNLDATVSSRSTFDHTTNQVLLTTTTQDQINAIEASFSGLGITFVTTGTPTTTSVPIFGTNLGDTTGDHNRQLCVFTSGGDGVIGVARWITTFTATGEGAGTLAFSGSANTPDAELPVAPAAGVSGIILGRR